MESKGDFRVPVSQTAHTVEIPKETSGIGGNVTIEINEKKRFYC